MTLTPPQPIRSGFCIYIHTFFQGPVPIERDEKGFFVVHATLREAQREIADYTIERIQQFLEGERDYDDAMTVEEYVVAVQILPDGTILDEDGRQFGADGSS